MDEATASSSETGLEVAIVGMAGRFPGASDISQLWRNLCAGVESVSFFSDEELLPEIDDPAYLADPRYVKARGVLAGAELFDAEFFGYSPREAEMMDPQHRLFLECAWEALEDAGCDPGRYRGLIGIYGGTAASSYLFNLLSRPDLMDLVGEQAVIGNDKDFLCTRVAYKLNLEGPSVVVQTACSTSLCAVHLACQALLSGECDMALAGGVSVVFPQQAGYWYQENGIMSPDGHCRAFDSRAKGSVSGAGVGLVVLKRLASARADGDSIRAVIKGSAINNDGLERAGYTAPRVDGQAKVIRAAQLMAEVAPETITYVETHGTGTELGDPIEIAALSQAFGAAPARGSCAIGSIKTNLGHLNTAAGVTGLIKATLALGEGLIPPTLHFERPNPVIDLASTPFFVNTALRRWEANGVPRRAGVSSFGIGGTNAHVVLEEAPPVAAAPPRRAWHLLLLSARSAPALDAATARLASGLRQSPELDLADIAYTCQVGRRAFQHRRALVCRDPADAIAVLAGEEPERLLSAARPVERTPVAFLFPGLGDHYPDMGLGLYRSEPVFRAEVERSAELLRPHLGIDLLDVLYPGRTASSPPAAAPGVDLRAMLRPDRDGEGAAARPLRQTLYAQTALFVLEHALARLWMSWGIVPQAMLGYSLGEYVTACLADVLSLADALALVARRARLIQGLPAGAMLAVPLSEQRLRPRLGEPLSLCAVNGPALCVVGGPEAAVAGLAERLAAEGVICRRVQTSHAFHSRMMEPILPAFRELVRSFDLHAPRIPYLSNVTGTWIQAGEATDPEYWLRHLYQAVRFGDGVAELWRERLILLEVGPGQALGSLALQHPAGEAGASGAAAVLPSLRHEHDRQDDAEFLLRSLGRLWLAGAEVDWDGFHAGERRRRVPLPTYPFERQRLWVERRRGAPAAAPAPGKILDIADWFHVPCWKHSPQPRRASRDLGGNWLVFLDPGGLGERLVDLLAARGGEVTAVEIGDRFRRLGDRRFALDPAAEEGYEALFTELGTPAPRRIVHLWNVTAEEARADLDGFAASQSLGFYSLLSLAQALARRGSGERLDLFVVANGLWAVESADRVEPRKMTLLGPARVIPQELPEVGCRIFDVRPDEMAGERLERFAAALTGDEAEPVTAWRGACRWVPTFDRIRLTEEEGAADLLRQGGVYLVTGGLGGIGAALAEHLARRFSARLVLVGRSTLPPRAEWPRHLAAGGDVARHIERLQSLEAAGAEVLALAADVADEAGMRAALAAAKERFGRIDGVFHAAGLPGVGLLQVKTRAAAAAVMAPKVQGTLVLASVLRDEPLDFLVLFSSIASITGGIGNVDYSAANAFLGAFAQRRHLEGNTPVLAIEWCEWQWDGWTDLLMSHEPEIREELRRQRDLFGLTYAEGMAALERVLASGLPQVVVSTRDFLSVLARRRSLGAMLGEMEKDAPATRSQEERPRRRLETPYVAPRDGVERRLAGFWQELLGVEPVGVHDDFFQLGGHSLIGLQLLSRVRAAFQVEIPLRALFEAPTVARLRAALRDDGSLPQTGPAPDIERLERTAAGRQRFPLSFAQQRLWFIDQMDPGSTAYNIASAFVIRGPLRPEALARSLGEIVRRHESLRTTFAAAGDEVFQVVAPPAALAMPVVELEALPAARRWLEARRLAGDDRRTPFDLGRGPLLRMTLLRPGAAEAVVLLAMHHIVGDAWSMGVMIRELAALYGAFAADGPSPLPELPLQYADFAVWQRAWLQGEVLERQLAFWRSRLQGAEAVLHLPTDRPRPAVQTPRGAIRLLGLSSGIAATLVALGHREGATLFMTLLAGFQALLHRYTGQDDVSVGSPIAGRNRPELEELIGFFANTLVLRTGLAGSPGFRELLARVRESALGAYANQDLPFEKLVEELQPERNLAYAPLFQTMFALQNATPGMPEAPGLELLSPEGDVATTLFDLTLTMTEGAGELRGTLEYSSDLFDAVTIERLLGHLTTLLAGAAADPDLRLDLLPLLSVAERQQLRCEWNDTASGPLRDRCVHELFAQTAARVPDLPAVLQGRRVLTYCDLDRAADRLAHHLVSLGVGPEVAVAICLERSIEMAVAILAVLKAGGAFVPLDPDYPADRLAWILGDSRTRVLLTREALAARLPAHPDGGLRVVSLGEIAAEEPAPTAPPRSGVEPESPAYVIYTSGSTGQPKGSVVPHRALAGYALDMVVRFRLRPDDRVLQFASVGFDVVVEELFPAWLAGAAVVLEDPGRLASPRDLAGVIAESGVTVMELPAAYWHEWVRELADLGRRPAPLRLLIVGSEKPLPERLRTWSGLGIDLIYIFGLTETTVTSSLFELPPGATGDELDLPIGRPVADTALHVVDPHFSLQPIGVPGELCVGGVGVSRGYLGRPDLTAARFVPDPFAGKPGARLYRTGDLARCRRDGNVEFLGRLDQQVKIRGFRIEPGEIEAALSRHPAVREVVVVVREDAATGRGLVAYVVPAAPAEGMRPVPEQLRGFLQERLPEHMVPAAFVLLESLPLTPHGKLDRRALPAPERTVEEDPAGSGDPVAEVLAAVWGEVLGIASVGPRENFFALGGHSLLATRVVSRIREAFRVELPLRSLFEHPTVADLAVEITARRRGGSGMAIPPLAPVAEATRGAVLPLSFAQQRLWFLDQIVPGSPLYNIPVSVALEGALDRSALAAALSEVARRHEILRTTFGRAGDEPVQVIHAPSPVPLPVVDLAGLPGELRHQETAWLAREEARRPFDLAAGPLLRATLLASAEAEHVLLTVHHIVSDGWSMGLLVSEMGALFGAFARRAPSPLPDLPLQYADFACWQRSWLAGDVLAAELAWWRDRLAGVPVLDLPTDHPRPAVQTARGASQPFFASRELTERLRALARGAGATPFMGLLAAFQTLLARYSGQDDIAIGTPVAGRSHRQMEELIGFFVNTLVVRTDLTGEPDYLEILARVREEVLGAFTHQDLPFEKLVEELRPDRDLSRTPLYQAVFTLENAAPAPRDLPGLRLRPFGVDPGMAKFDLTLVLVEAEWGVGGRFEHNLDLFEEATVRRMAAHFGVLLEALVADPASRVSQVPLLTAAEETQIFAEWNDTAKVCPQIPLVHERFAGYAAERPGAIAVASRRHWLTYGEVEARANRLAHHLRTLGVGPEVLVALCTERTPERVIGIVAVLKAGGAYVSLDPIYPKERLAFLLEDARAPVLLTQERFLEALPDTGAAVICLDRDWESIQGDASRAPDSGVGPENLSYVVYTSGSTGRPKGVKIPHAGLMNLVRWHQDLYSVRPGDRGTQIASPAFDASIWELWPYLAGGASVHIPDEETRLSSPGMLRWWAEEEITLAYLMTPLAEGVLEEGLPPGPALPTRALIIGGDRLHHRPVPGVSFRLMNHYGPAEYTVTSTVVPVPPVGEGSGIPTIGRPVDNTWIYILGRRQEPVPVGVHGELYVAGLGLARGYLRRPDLTAEKFVPDPFAAERGEPGARMYRTADLVCWMGDGDIDFLGRLDHQVKLRGLRIELGEIETVLGQHPALREVAVLVREDRPGQRRLTAYLVASEASEGDRPAVEELRLFLKDRLPEYMVPAAFVYLESLPLTPNGKVDRRALPAPEAGAERAYVAPRTPLEELLAGTFAELLGVERVGVEDDFFELGGHSLLATRLIARLREALRIDLPVRSVFEAPSVADLAAELTTRLRGGPGQAAPTITAVSRDGRLPLSFAQQRLWFLDQMVPGSPLYNVALSVVLEGTLGRAALAAALGEVVRRHEALRTTFGRAGDEPVQVVHPPVPMPPPVVDLTGLAGESRNGEAIRLVREEALRPFDLAAGPLLRTTLLALAKTEHLLLLTAHHIASDGWSMGLLVGELGTLYGAASRGEPSPLPDLPIQYADFACWQRRWLAGDVLAAELAWWRDRLTGVPVLDLPTDRPRPAVQTARGASFRFSLPEGRPAEWAAAVRALAHRARATPFMALLAVFQTLLARYSGQDDIAVGTPVAGRSHRQMEELIGFFVNTLVVRSDLTGEPDFPALLARVREGVLGAFTHQDLPFEKLVEELRPDRDLSRTPLFQTVFTLEKATPAPRELPGLRLRPFGVDPGTAKFDLTLVLTESSGGLRAELEYNRDLFDESTVRRMAAHSGVLLEALVAEPASRVSQVPLLTAAERAQVFAEWNDTAKVCPQIPMVHARFAGHAAERPGAIAVASRRHWLTYGEVEAQANRLAHHLRTLGVGPEVLVALCTERTPERVIGIVAVLKAGGAYVSLDPTYPKERLAFLLEDARAPVLLTEARFLEALPDTGATVICLERDWESIQGDASRAPDSGVTPENLAYVVYTSGSTGRPKGVEIPHAGLMNLVRWHQDLYSVRPGDRGTQIASPAFDASIWELWPYLAGGASVHIPDEETRLSSPGMLRWWAEEEITLAYLMTPLAEGVLEEGLPPGPALPTRALIIGGDRLHRRPVPGVSFRLMNHYGPAEYTVTSTVVPVPPVGEGSGIPTIGRPVDNTWIYILGRRQEPVPVGVHGELYVAGLGLARGYLRRPDLTAEKFVPDPFAAERGEPGARMYRTADLVRWTGDGDIDFLGRLDHQVKLRGLRIELGEIETVLGQHPALREVAVLVREDRPGQRRLTAYLVASEASEGDRPMVEELRLFLKDRLPEYMVPAAFVYLESLPMTPNGKVDRRALPAPEAGAERAYAAPRTPLEEQLAGIFAEILGMERVGVEDDFFELGGHSLLAARLMARIEERGGRSLPLALLFQGGTVRHLAAALGDGAGAPHPEAASPLVTLQVEGDLPPFFCVHPLSGTIVCYRSLAQHLGTARPFYAFQARGVESDAAPHATVEEMAAFYVTALRDAQSAGPYHLGGWSFGALVAFEMACQLAVAGVAVGALVLCDTPAPGMLPGGIEDEAASLAGFALEAGLPVTEDELRRLGPNGQVAHVAALAAAAGLLPANLAEQLLRRRLGVYRASLSAAQRYVPRLYPGRITLLRANEPMNDQVAELAARDPGYGWGIHASPLTIHVVPGNHGTVLEGSHAATTAAAINQVIEEAEAGRPVAMSLPGAAPPLATETDVRT